MIKPYPTYTDCELPWIPNFPNHWILSKLKYSLDEIIGGGTPDTSNPDFWDDENGIPWVAISDITKQSILTETSKKISESGRQSKGLQIIPRGTLLLSIFASLGKTTLLGIDATVNQAILGLIPSEKLNRAFLSYFLSDIERYINYYSSSNTQENLNLTKIRNLNITLPPLPEQQAIADFLDRKTAQIDTLIEKKRRQIDLLQEQRTALINHAVTKGLNSNVRMKDSGVEWLGEIPSHWESSKLKFLVEIRYGLGQPPKELANGLPIIRATNVERGKIVSKDMVYIDPSDVPPSRNAILKENEIIVVRSGAYTADSAIVTKEYAGAVAGYDMVVTPTSINAQLLAYAFLSHYVLKHQLYLQRMRAAQPHLNAEELGDTSIIYPPSEKEQIEIVNYLDDVTKKISETIARTNKQIELLQEYRTALISEAVTGKIDVR